MAVFIHQWGQWGRVLEFPLYWMLACVERVKKNESYSQEIAEAETQCVTSHLWDLDR